MRIAFEPWSLGDALIAAYSISRLQKVKNEKVALSCAERHHELIKAIFPSIKLLAIDLHYTVREKQYWKHNIDKMTPRYDVTQVYSIRGDLRDYRVSKILYPNADRFFSGWKAFFARRIPLLDLPFRMGLAPTRSRYDAWSYLLDLPLESKFNLSSRISQMDPKNSRIVIHTGAQWGSKRYPMAVQLFEEIKKRGANVVLAYGPGDPCPSDNAIYLSGTALVDFLKENCELLVTNDSGPMHLGFSMQIQTIALFGNTGVEEWCPPRVTPMGLNRFRRGYSPQFCYKTDINGTQTPNQKRWLYPEEIVDRLFSEEPQVMNLVPIKGKFLSIFDVRKTESTRGN